MSTNCLQSISPDRMSKEESELNISNQEMRNFFLDPNIPEFMKCIISEHGSQIQIANNKQFDKIKHAFNHFYGCDKLD